MHPIGNRNLTYSYGEESERLNGFLNLGKKPWKRGGELGALGESHANKRGQGSWRRGWWAGACGEDSGSWMHCQP